MSHMIDLNLSYSHTVAEPCTHPFLAPVILEICARFKVRRIIDVGCGNGFLYRSLHDAGYSVVGMEPSDSGIAICRESIPYGTFYQLGLYGDSNEMKETDFDLAVSTEVIEHLFKPSALPEFVAGKLRRGGILLVSTPYHGYLKNLVISVLNKWDTHHSPETDGGHIKFWSRKTLTHLLESHGFEVLEFIGCGRAPLLWKSMILVARKKST